MPTGYTSKLHIPVMVGDVFAQSSVIDYAVVVVLAEVGGARVECRRAHDGRRSRIAARRLQREYARLGEVAASRAHKMIEAIDRRAAK